MGKKAILGLLALAGFAVGLGLSPLGDSKRLGEPEDEGGAAVGGGVSPSSVRPGSPGSVKLGKPRRGLIGVVAVEVRDFAEVCALSEAELLEYLLGRLKADPEGALAEAVRLDRAGSAGIWQNSYTHWLLGRLVLGDPARAREVLATLELQGGERSYLKRRIAWLEKGGDDPVKLLERLLESDRWLGHSGIGDAMLKLSKEDPAAAFSYFERMLKERPHLLHNGSTTAAMRRMAEQDPDAFGRLRSGVKEDAMRGLMTNALARVLGERDTGSALDLLEAMPLSRQRTVATLHFLMGWAERDPAAAAAWARDGLKGSARLRGLAAALPPDYVRENAHGVIELFRSLPEFASRSEGRDSLTSLRVWSAQGSSGFGQGRWRSMREAGAVFEQAVLAIAENDPQAALQAAAIEHEEGQTLDRHRVGVLAKVLGGWAASEPLQALVWLGEQDSETVQIIGQNDSFTAGFSELSANDLRASLEMMVGFEQQTASMMLRSMVRALAEGPPDDSLAFVDSLPEDLASRINPELVASMARWHPTRAAEEIERVPEGLRNSVRTTIVSRLSQQNPAAAFEYVQGIPEENRTEGLYSQVLPRWARLNWEEARTWYEELPEGTERGYAIQTIELQRFREGEASGQETLNIFMGLEEGRRRDSIRRLMSTWVRRDREAAEAAFEAADLDEQTRTQVERMMR